MVLRYGLVVRPPGVRVRLNAWAADRREVINRKTTKSLEVTLAEENDQKIRMKVLGRHHHTTSSPGTGGTLA